MFGIMERFNYLGGIHMKKIFANKNNRISLALFLSTMVAYVIIFATAFVKLPISIGPVHQLLLLLFHFVPMFFLELLLCQLTRPLWRILAPTLLLAVPVLIFVAVGEFYVLAWILAGLWCIAPVVGSLLAYLVWHINHRLKKGNA